VGLISLTFDDGLRCQFSKAVPVLDTYGLPATFFLTANQDSIHEAWNGHKHEWWKIDWRDEDVAALRRLIDNGHEVGSHSLTHRLEHIQRDPVAEACESKELIEGWLGTKIRSFCYPYYRSHPYLANAVKNAGYEQARGGFRGSYYTVPADRSFDKFNIDCRQVSLDDKASNWVRHGCWHVLTFHAVGTDRDGWEPISVEQFEILMAEIAGYRDLGIVEVLTFNDAAARFQSRPCPGTLTEGTARLAAHPLQNR